MLWSLLLALALGQEVPADSPQDPPPVEEPAGEPAPAPIEEPAAPDALPVVPEGLRGEHDVVLYVRKDGNFFVDDKLLLDTDIPRVFALRVEEDPQLRLVIVAHVEAPYGRLLEAISAARNAGVEVAVEAPGLAPELDQEVEEEDPNALVEKPRRRKYPQSPRAHTDFTAYTLERGETRIGLAQVSHGITPRVQLATVPIADALGLYNINVKGNLVRHNKFDGALIANYYFVPIAKILNRLGVGGYLNPTNKKKNDPEFTSRLTYFELGARGSLRLADAWSAHLGIAYARIGATGRITLGRLPSVNVPEVGKIGGGQISVVPAVVGELMQFKFATDYRFNRRDSLIFQLSAPMYVGVRGVFAADEAGLGKNLSNFYAAIGYDQWIPLESAYAASIAWQFSWKHLDFRAGIGGGPSPLWIFQAFDLSYRFGGVTRRDEQRDRYRFKMQKRAEKQSR